jgi:integrase
MAMAATTLAMMFSAYKYAWTYKNLAPSSKSSYDFAMTMAERYFGADYKVGSVISSRSSAAYTIWCNSHGVPSANLWVSVLKSIWTWDNTFVINPWAGIVKQTTKPRTQLWTEQDYKQALTMSYGTELYALIDILWETGQRPKDILSLKLNDLKPGPAIELTQQKTGTKVRCPISLPLHLTILGMFRHGDTVFSDFFYRNYLNNFARIKANGFPSHLQLRDIRRTVATQMADGGASDAQIRSALGHAPNSTITESVYIQRTDNQAQVAFGLRNHTVTVNVKIDDDDDFSG